MEAITDEVIDYEINHLEEKLLYIMLKYPEKQAYIIQNSTKDFFKDKINGVIYERARAIYEKGDIVDPSIICENFKGAMLDNIILRLYDILAFCFAPSVQAGLYCKTLFERQLVNSISCAKTKGDFEQIETLKNSFCFDETEEETAIGSNIEELLASYTQSSSKAILTMYTEIDNCIGSFMGGDYIVLGASTSIGKSTFALNVARRVCMQDKKVLYFSLEMPKQQLQNKFICMQEELNANKQRNFGLTLEEWGRYKQGAENLSQWDLDVVCDYCLTIEKMRFRMEKHRNTKGLDFVVLDYLGLLKGYENKSFYERTTLLSRSVKLLATEFDVPILCIVQLNRDIKNRQDKRPCLFDIRESGAIEQDADIVMLLHREGIYDKTIPPNVLEVIVAKNRHGESNKIFKLDFDLATQAIKEFNYGYS